MKHLPFAIAPLALALPSLALATDVETTPREIVITADRSLAPAAERLDAATVITRQDIERQQATSVADLIAQSAGISLPATGGPLTSTGVFLRGFKSNQVLVLIDGVRANDANAGQFDLSLLRPEDVERIEVVRGGYSSQYGSDAMGGVIQIFTRKQAENSVTLRAGSFKTREETLSLGQRNDKGGISLSLSQLDTAGFNAGDKNYAAANFAIPNPDKDGGDRRTLRIAGDRQLGNGATLSGQSILQDGHAQFDNGVTAQTFALSALKYRQQVTENYLHQVDFGYQRTKLNTDGDFGFNAFDTQRYTLDWTHTLRSQQIGTTTGGVNLIQEQAYGIQPDVSQRLLNNGVFLINEKSIGNFSYRLSGRHDHHESYGDHNTGSLRLGYQLSSNLEAYAGYGSNFRAPTASELYCFSPFYSCSNPALRPESSRQRDIGLIWRPAAGHQLGLNAYRSDIRDLINYNGNFQLDNVGHARLDGIELDAAGQFGATGYRLGLLRARAIDTDTGNALLRRPRAQFSGDLHRRLGERLVIGAQLLSRSNTPDYDVPTQGFAVFNAYASWRATPKLQLGLRLDNLTDKVYETTRGYSTPARSAYVTLRYRF